MLPPSSTTLAPFSSANAVTQEIRLINSQQGEKAIAIKFKLNYNLNGQAVR
jgi:hypothetical protein